MRISKGGCVSRFSPFLSSDSDSPLCGWHCVSNQSSLKCEISIERPELVKQTEVAKGSPIDLLIHAWNIDYDVYFYAHLGSPLLPPTSSLHVVGYEIKSLLVPCMIKLLWYASFPRFAVSRMMKMWGEKNKRKINNIWANMNTAWTWVGLVWMYGSCCGSWGMMEWQEKLSH